MKPVKKNRGSSEDSPLYKWKRMHMQNGNRCEYKAEISQRIGSLPRVDTNVKFRMQISPINKR